MQKQAFFDFSDYMEGELAILQNELAKLTRRLVEQNQALENDKKYLADAMADISHQLRSPLTSIRLLLTLLKEPALSDEKRRESLRELSMLIDRMDWLIETLLKSPLLLLCSIASNCLYALSLQVSDFILIPSVV